MDVLHAARNYNNLLLKQATGQRTAAETFLQEAMTGYMYSEEEALDAVVSYIEQNCRYTWELDPQPTEIYRCFRIVGAPDMGDGTCLHGDGLELYGDVYEE